jgi:hypothetical protein
VKVIFPDPDVPVTLGLAKLPARFPASLGRPQIGLGLRAGQVTPGMQGDLVGSNPDELVSRLLNFFTGVIYECS